MTASLSINGFDLWTTIGFYLTDPGGVFDAVDRVWPRIPIYGRAGVFFGSPAQEGSRSLVFKGGIKTAAATTAARVAAEDQLKDTLRAGLLRIVRGDGVTTDREIEGYCTRISITPIGNTLTSSDSRIQFSVDTLDSYWRDLQPTFRALAVTATRYTVPQGTAPSTPIIRIMGSASNPVLTYRDAGGTVIRTLTITATLGAADYLDIDMRVGRIVQYTSGVAGGSPPVFTGDFPWALDPQDGNYTLSAWPTVEVTPGTGEVLWWKRWQ